MTGALKALGSRAIIGAFNKSLEEASTASWVGSLAMVVPTNQEVETYDFLSDTPAFKEWASERTKTSLKAYEFSIRNKKWSAQLEIDEDDWRRDKTGSILVRTRDIAKRAVQLPQKVLSSLLVANGNAYDGVAFFHATNHKNLNGDTIANAIQVAAATGTTPTNAEMETAILTAIETILGWKDDAGEPRNEFAQSFTVMVPVQLWKQVKAVLKNDYIASGQSNSLKSTEFTITPVMNPRLTSSAMFYVFRDDSDVKALVWQDEVMPVMQYEFSIQKDMHYFPAKRVGNGGYGRFDQACRVEFT